MKCQFCNENLPDNSEFCLFCGKKLITDSGSCIIESDIGTNRAALSAEPSVKPCESDSVILTTQETKIRYCKYCGGTIDISSNKCKSCGKRAHFVSKKNLALVISIILLVTVMGALIIQRFVYKENEKQYLSEISVKDREIADKKSSIDELETENVIKDTEIQSLNDQINELNEQVVDFEKDSETLDAIISFLQSSNAGFASSNFKASDKIFVVEKYNSQTSFTLTCSFSGNTTISTNTKGTAAKVTFSQSSWYGGSTKLYIKPNSVGTSIVTFSNNQNTQTFSILIVVID